MEYKAGEIERLHEHLYDILARTIEVCEALSVRYFIIGGTAIGAHYDGAILPWDDDIDIGMERGDYERFRAHAAEHLPEGYVVQSPVDEPHTPYYFMKVRKSGTIFEGEDEAGLDMHHGVYIDIFPMDRVPKCRVAERVQRGVVRHLVNAFVASTIELREGGVVQKWVVKRFATIFGKRLIYRMLTAVQGVFNGCNAEYVNIIYMPRDHIRLDSLHPADRVRLGELEVDAPREMEEYLNHHYPNLHRHEGDERVTHAPVRLKL